MSSLSKEFLDLAYVSCSSIKDSIESSLQHLGSDNYSTTIHITSYEIHKGILGRQSAPFTSKRCK